MARTVTLNGVNFSVPEPGDQNYDQALTNYLVALASGFIGSASSAETPGGTANGTNPTFTLASTPAGTLLLYVDRVLQVPGTDYTLSGNVITFIAGAIPLNLALIRAYY